MLAAVNSSIVSVWCGDGIEIILMHYTLGTGVLIGDCRDLAAEARIVYTAGDIWVTLTLPHSMPETCYKIYHGK